MTDNVPVIRGVLVVGVMPIEQFKDWEQSDTTESGLTKAVEEEIREDFGEILDDIKFWYTEDALLAIQTMHNTVEELNEDGTE